MSMKNEYTARKVGMKDMQSCMICHKPTVTVLYNGLDWFYICDIHLQDNPQFVTPLYSNEYKESLSKLKLLKPSTVANNGSNWDGWVSKLLKRENKGQETSEGEQSTTNQKQELQRQYDQQLDLVSKLQQQNKRYQLNRIMFESRIQRKQMEARLKEQKRIEEESYSNTDPQELQTKFTFPSVPKN